MNKENHFNNQDNKHDIPSTTDMPREIENALRARGLKEAMNRWDAEARLQSQRPKKVHWKPITITALLSPIAVAALLAGILFVGPQTWRNEVYRQGRQIARYLYRPKASPSLAPEKFYALASSDVATIHLRYADYADTPSGCNSLIYEAIAEMQEQHYSVALHNLHDAKAELDIDASMQADSIRRAEDDIAYLEAVCHYMLGHTQQARRLLKAIAQSPSAHQASAADLLQQLARR